MSNYSDSAFNEESANTSWYKVFHLIEKSDKVLDVGCSSGNFGTELINRKGCIVDGLELDKADARTASKRLRKVFVKNIETDSLSDLDKDYDVIYFGDVIEHLVDPANALKRISKHLSKDGRIVFSIPNMAHISVRLMLLGGKFEYTETGLLDKTHLHFYTLEEIERVFHEAGLEINHMDFVEKDYPRALIRKVLQKSGLSAKSKFFEISSRPDAAAFQFVGSAKVSDRVKPRKLKQFGPIDLFEDFHNDTVKSYKAQLKEVESLRTENAQLKSLLRDIKRRPHKLVYRKLKSSFKK